jgi:hypothetical protein
MLHDGHPLAGGCILIGEGDAIGQPIWLCPDARALQSIERLTAALTTAAPDEPFFRRLARVTTDALAAHLASSKRSAADIAEPDPVVPPSPPASTQTSREVLVT